MGDESEFTAGLRESCGLFGCILAEGVTGEVVDPASTTVNALSALQHRGNESSGMVGMTACGDVRIHKAMGQVREVYNQHTLASTFKGCPVMIRDCVACVGHNRYSTAGLKDAINCIQPFVIHTLAGKLAIAHNGELVDARHTRKQVLRRGVGLSTDSDSELIAQILAACIADSSGSVHFDEKGIAKELLQMMGELTLSYALVVLVDHRLYAVRDPWGNRPLSLGVLQAPASNGHISAPLGWVITSETCALQPPAKFVRHVQPGEIVEITRTDGIISRPDFRKRLPPSPSQHRALCVFEYVYFARPDSMLEDRQVNSVREACGRQLAIESPADVHLVSNVPESATPAALGYAQYLGKPYVQVLYKNSYVGRSFIQPNNTARQTAVHRKFGVFSEKVAGKNVVLVDDSIVRGNTMGPIVKLLKDNGANQVHIRLASPPLMHPCYMGVNIPDSQELIAHRLRVKQADGSYAPDLDALAAHTGAQSVRYLSLDGLLRAVQDKPDDSPVQNTGHCVACLTGEYPVAPKHLDW